MGAIDLLFDVKRDSERLHQLVLGALLSRTALVDRLVPRLRPRQSAATESATESATAGLFDDSGLGLAAKLPRPLLFDPQGKAFDLAILTHASPAAPGQADGHNPSVAEDARRRPRLRAERTTVREHAADRANDADSVTAGLWDDGGRVLVEVKIDTPLSEDHLAQQLSRMQPNDHLLCLLLGYSAISSDRPALRERIDRIGRHSARPDLLDRVSLRDARDLISLLSDPGLVPPESEGGRSRDTRDLAVAYRDALLSLQARLHGFSGRPLTSWNDGDFYGFYAACREGHIGSFAQARIGRLASADGSVLGCRGAPLTVLSGQALLDLAFEGPRLCLRLSPQPFAHDSRRELREAAQGALGEVGLTTAEPSLRFGEAPPRLTAVMTLAFCDDLLTAPLLPSALAEGGRLHRALLAADDMLRKVSARLGPG